MEQGCQKSKRLSYKTKFKHKVIRCAQQKGNRKAAAILELIKATSDCGRNTRQRSAGVRRHKENSLDPRKDDFLKFMMQSSCFFMRRKKKFRYTFFFFYERPTKCIFKVNHIFRILILLLHVSALQEQNRYSKYMFALKMHFVGLSFIIIWKGMVQAAKKYIHLFI
jgi:hypothetical protein